MNCVLELDAKAILGEGPYWDHHELKLYWVDILANSLHVFDPLTKNDQILEFPKHVCAVSKKDTDELILALKDGIYFYHLKTGEITLAAKTNNLLDPEIRFNDGKCDPQGRFWAGTMNVRGEKHQGTLYCYLPDGTLKTMLTGVSISNGLAWDKVKNKMYFIDTPTQQIVSYDFDRLTGEIRNGEVVYTFCPNDGSPDGLTIDSEGMLWVALWGGGRVAKVNPQTKEWLSSVEVPASLVTSCVFGGEDLHTLYITTARIGLSEEELADQPQAGGLFSIQLEEIGTQCNFYKKNKIIGGMKWMSLE